MPLRLLIALVLLLATTVAAQDRRPPRFRGGANLVRVDAYVTADGAALTDLRSEDFEVLEDDVPQRVETFELIAPRGPVPQAVRQEPNTARESLEMATDPSARVFVLFMDIWHVQVDGSYRAKNPITTLLDRVIGQDDLVGVMTPEMSARNLTLARRTTTIEGMLKDNWFWGERGQAVSPDPREQQIELCYPDGKPETTGLAKAMIERRRERKTLDALDDLIDHLEGVRDERKFVLLLSEGWVLHTRDETLARPIAQAPGAVRTIPGGPQPVRVDPEQGRLRIDPTRDQAYDSCERERAMLAFADHQLDFRRMLQRANRANVSFYPVDPRGLAAFDDPIGPVRPATPAQDRERMTARQNALKELAENTDGFWVLNTNQIDRALERLVVDTSSYYLLGYYSTNPKLDGRFRRITVRVKRPGSDVRARPGYLAPTESELASARVNALMDGAPPGHSTAPPTDTVSRVLTGLGAVRGNVPLRATATGGPGYIWFTGEVDAATLKKPEWQEGGQAHITIEHERGDVNPLVADVTLEPGQRMFSLVRPEGGVLAPGRYVVRVQLTSKRVTVPLQTTVDAVVPNEDALIARSAVALRRGPTTGLLYQRTADTRFRRTERVRLEIPKFSSEAKLEARLLNRDGQVLPLTIGLSERADEPMQRRFIVADLTLAPLAQGEYVMEVVAAGAGRKESINYGFSIVP
ncbi:MAG: VWA domain-containing protein [Vicinamibacterales bacterium]